LNETKLVVEQAVPSMNAISLLQHTNTRTGKFSDVISLTNSRARLDVLVTGILYSQSTVAYYIHGQNWPGIGWGVLPVAVLVAVAFVSITVLVARKIAFLNGETEVSVF
jgi:hypothetical protein